MFRRNFIQRFTLASAAGLAGAGLAAGGARKTVIYRIKGFTCITCAVGLDTMLTREKGVFQSHSSYPEGRAVIEFDPGLISNKTIQELIAEIGFRVIEETI